MKEELLCRLFAYVDSAACSTTLDDGRVSAAVFSEEASSAARWENIEVVGVTVVAGVYARQAGKAVDSVGAPIRMSRCSPYLCSAVTAGVVIRTRAAAAQAYDVQPSRAER